MNTLINILDFLALAVYWSIVGIFAIWACIAVVGSVLQIYCSLTGKLEIDNDD